MRLKVQLDDNSLFKMCRIASRYNRRLQHKLVSRVVGDLHFAIWEMPYNHPDMTKEFLARLSEIFPPEILKEKAIFVNNGAGGAHQCFVAAGFPEALYEHVQPALSQFIGVIQNFEMSPEALIALSVLGMFEMETKATPNSVDKAYGPNKPETGPGMHEQ